MGRRPGISCKVYRGDVFLGEAEVFPAAKNSDGKGQSSPFPNTNEIRVDYLSFPASGAFPSPSSKPSPLSPSAANFKPECGGGHRERRAASCGNAEQGGKGLVFLVLLGSG
ncbi:C-terminal domain phosphatase-like [Musa troglodytarum]|uniref:C-terminal domain phosphatase-like n=1 Tax=Musa troglodytarum TaxID=320322 RepID=A0A9E7JGS0_9LILI|nr:C-terminal domain phosphatase-like [Musa troglodytarum]